MVDFWTLSKLWLLLSPQRHCNDVVTNTATAGKELPKDAVPKTNTPKHPETAEKRRRKSQSGHDGSDRDSLPSSKRIGDADLNLPEYVDRVQRDNGQAHRPENGMQKRQTEIDEQEGHNSADSIKNIINEVRSELLALPKKEAFLSDESPSQRELVFAKTTPKAVENKSTAKAEEEEKKEASDEDVSDDVFSNPLPRGRHASFSAKDKKFVHPKRRTSSLEDLTKFQKSIGVLGQGEAGGSGSRKTSSSVSINETPQVHMYDAGANSFKTLRSIARRPVTNSTSSFNSGLALLNTQPVRGSLKKSDSSTSKPAAASKSSPKKPASKKSPKHVKKPTTSRSSDYDPRDRRRDGNGNERDMYRYRDRERDRGDRDKDLSDRDQKDSQNDSFNRSLSNTEGTPDDKIGK